MADKKEKKPKKAKKEEEEVEAEEKPKKKASEEKPSKKKAAKDESSSELDDSEDDSSEEEKPAKKSEEKQKGEKKSEKDVKKKKKETESESDDESESDEKSEDKKKSTKKKGEEEGDKKSVDSGKSPRDKKGEKEDTKSPRDKKGEKEDTGKSPRDKKGEKEDTKSPRDKKGEKEKSPRETGKSPRGEKEAPEPHKKGVLRDGKVYLVVSEAKGLLAKNMFGKGSDPYVEIYLDDGKSKAKDQIVHKSKVLKKELDPSWNESSKIFPIKAKHKAVRIQLKNANKLLSDRSLGQVVVPLVDVNDGVPVDKWFPLEGRKKKEKVKGKVHVQMLFLDPEENMIGEEFNTPLQCFIKKRKVDILAELIKKEKVDIEKADTDGYRPLHAAALNNLPDAVSMLLANGAKINAKGGKKSSTPLHSACQASTASAVVLIENGAKLDAEDDDGNKPIHIAALNDQPKSIACLLEKGASISDQNKEGNTPLHLAIQAKAFLSLKLLVEKGADIYIKNNANMTCGEMAADLDEETKEIFMKAVGVEDYQEIALLQTWKHRIRFEANGLNYEWQKSPQFAITSKSKVKCRFFVHHIGSADNHNLGYCVVKGKATQYKEPSLSELVGHGGTEAFEAEIDPELATIVVPYAKSQEQPDKVSLLVFTKEEGEVEVTPLVDWQFDQSVKGQWKGKMAGGCQSEQNRKTWHKNPFFSLHIPEKKDVDVCIVLQQKKNAMESIIPYQILPYDYYIGFYLYDADVEHLQGQTTKWKNAMEVLQHFTLDGTKMRQYTIIPTTFNAKEETTFTLSVYSNEKRVTLKAFES